MDAVIGILAALFAAALVVGTTVRRPLNGLGTAGAA
jgi:hypothetical protein